MRSVSCACSDMDEFARAGLRTLLVAATELTADRYADWNKAYAAALGDVTEQVSYVIRHSNSIDIHVCIHLSYMLTGTKPMLLLLEMLPSRYVTSDQVYMEL